MRRLVPFYGIIAVIGVAVVILVVNKGGNEKALPSIAGGYSASAANACIGPVPKPAGGIPLPSSAPATAAATGPSFNVLQSGEFINLTNNQGTLGGQLRLSYKSSTGGGHELTGKVSCVNGKSLEIHALVVAGLKGAIKGSLGGAPFAANLKSAPPAPGSAQPRTPSGVGGLYTLSPASTCFGPSFTITGGGPTYKLSDNGTKLGTVAYTRKTGTLFGDVKCVKGGEARVTATANDLLLQNVTVIPLEVATPAKSAVAAAKPVLTTPTGLGPAGEKVTATRQRPDFNHLVALVFLAIAITLIVARLFGIVAVRVGSRGSWARSSPASSSDRRCWVRSRPTCRRPCSRPTRSVRSESRPTWA